MARETLIKGRGDDDRCRDGNERIAQLVAFPSPVLKLEGKHRYLRDEQPGTDQHQQDDDARTGGERVEPVAQTEDQRSPEQRIGRSGQPDEAHRLALVKVELCQAQGRESCHPQSNAPHQCKRHQPSQ